MTSTVSSDWSPADHPYAIAVSEAQWWMRTAKLAVLRIRDEDEDRRVGFSSRQIDARQLVFALRQLLAAEELEQRALKDLGRAATLGVALVRARREFEQALPDIKNMRDGLNPALQDWARGRGASARRKLRARRVLLSGDVARMFWGFGYDPITGMVSFGPYAIQVDTAARAAGELARAIYLAAHEVDLHDIAAVRARVIAALDRAGLPHDSPDAMITISPGRDLKIWLSLRVCADADPAVDGQTAAQIVAALAADELRLVSPAESATGDVTDRLVRGEPLYVNSPSR